MAGTSPPPQRNPVLPGQESVWDYPRPPRVETSARRVRVELGGETVAESTRALRVLETSLAPSWYVPPADVRLEALREAGGRTLCEWKGAARYFDVVAGSKRAKGAAWSYPDPTPAFEALRDHVSFYPALVACFVDGERARPQPGGFYGGWITSDVAGPFKGAPGTLGW